MTHPDPTQRFSDRVDNYVRYRPSYPEGVLQILEDEAGLTPAASIADVGSGTGISSELFLRYGNLVCGVEPNQEMRQAAERLLAGYPRFHSLAGTAEATGLPDECVNFVVAGQSFHWFSVPKAKKEFARILHRDGWVVLLWNSRRLDDTSLLREYEDLLSRYGTDYEEVRRMTIDPAALEAFFAPGTFTARSLYNEQRLTFDGLKGRLLSSSYTPTPSHPSYRLMLDELVRIFERNAEDGQVCIEYDTEIYFGHLT